MATTEAQPLEEGATIETPSATLELLANDVVLLTAKPMAQDLAGARLVFDAVQEIRARRGRKIRLLVDMRQLRSLSHDARVLYQSEEYAANLVGAALMVDSGLSRVVGNFAMKFNDGPAIRKLFTSLDEARAWLESLDEDG